MDNPALWSSVLLGIAVILFVAEMFIPTGGAVGFLAAGCAVAGVIVLFQVSTTLGLIGAIVSVVGLPFLLIFALRIWPHTPIGQAMQLRNPASPKTEGELPRIVNDSLSSAKIGDTGRAISPLRPVGFCLINGERVECLAEGGIIGVDTAVRVSAVDGMVVKVREIDAM